MKKFILFLSLLSLLLVFGCQSTECLMPETEDMALSPDVKPVCLFFDDCYFNQYEVVLPILLKNNFKATFGVITGHIGEGHGIWQYMDEEQLQVIAGHGMDIACHTRNHLDLTANLTDEQLREEIVYPKIHMENMGFDVKTMIYPYFTWDTRVIDFVMDAGYICARAGWTTAREYDPRRGDPKARYNIPAHQITDISMEEFKAIVDDASQYSVVSLVYHFIADDGPEETSTPVENFKEQMAYLESAGFTVIPLPDLIGE